MCNKGTRIIVGWDPRVVDLMVLALSAQVVHTQIQLKADKKMIFGSFVYAHNYYIDHRQLWLNLCQHMLFVKHKPWCILGDFNATLSLQDTTAGSSVISIAMREFNECITDIEVSDVNSLGLQFIWNQKPQGSHGVLRKIDRVLANSDFFKDYIGAVVMFQPYLNSDHALPFLSFQVVKKLKSLKKPLRKLLVDKGNLHANVEKLKADLETIQKALDKDPHNSVFRDDEAIVLKAFNDALLTDERFLKQKAKIEWLRVGDSNSAYFHKVVKGKTAQNHIESIMDSNGRLQAMDMSREVTDEEVRKTIFSMGDDKSPGPDSYSAAFFKGAWNIIGEEVSAADCLQDIVSINQSAFIPGRLISDNILLTQYIMHNYHLDRGPPRCALKVDIQKAYDTVDWDFLKDILVAFGFPQQVIHWIMLCVTSVTYSLSINGSFHGYFKGKRGLRQGDPLSPYLFTLVMEILTLILHRNVTKSDSFYFHHLCQEHQVINLSFADDLFIFMRGNVDSARVVMDSLNEFKDASGLAPSLPKSTAYFCNVPNTMSLAILNIIPFEEGQLLVKYLGVPLVSSRLVLQDCKPFIEKVQKRVNDWRNKFLSFAGRVQLINSVLSAIHVYWSSVFILPMSIISDIEQIMRGFLWCQGEIHKGKAKVAWDDVCLPKEEGGLGICKLHPFNIALFLVHSWNIITGKESLWVKWVHTHKLQILLELEENATNKTYDSSIFLD
uniref:uncharacterized protein LOC122587785 n=1 Tax=Erigeron canadensis TaxID=72917 RepID=UPI001CB9C42D|nr:uncharacterized protein LOC122587785 [Erigeron canadensis]